MLSSKSIDAAAFEERMKSKRAKSASSLNFSAQGLKTKFASQLRKNYFKSEPAPVDLVNIHTFEHHCYRSYENIEDNYVYEQYHKFHHRYTGFEQLVESKVPTLFDYTPEDKFIAGRQKQKNMAEKIRLYYYSLHFQEVLNSKKVVKTPTISRQAQTDPQMQRPETARCKSSSIMNIKTQNGKSYGIDYRFEGKQGWL
ncbi:Hypothetical_protein [Hexamita inflata]|uniref:Hypothetical_protein n=1 Tax=Hexamita inflata TaxID=28002 RepID=A0AA86TTH5_9EUKA|nr:Hypothetical protein HINF_LOCUS15450 [Hexamita inflata]